MISLSMRPSTSMRNEMRTIGSFWPTISVTLSSEPRSMRLTFGGEISIFLLNIVESDVATVPIIWFIDSPTALIAISPISVSGFVPSPPIMRSAMMAASCAWIASTLLPSIPMVYPTSTMRYGIG